MAGCPVHGNASGRLVEGVVVCGQCGRPMFPGGRQDAWNRYTKQHGTGPRKEIVGGCAQVVAALVGLGAVVLLLAGEVVRRS